jgi:hypothetical protein
VVELVQVARKNIMAETLPNKIRFFLIYFIFELGFIFRQRIEVGLLEISGETMKEGSLVGCCIW